MFDAVVDENEVAALNEETEKARINEMFLPRIKQEGKTQQESPNEKEVASPSSPINDDNIMESSVNLVQHNLVPPSAAS